jgi:hypothetical protein
LIADTFEAVVSSSISQEEDWNQLDELLSMEKEVFISQVVDEEMIENELIRLFPNEEGTCAIVKGAKYTKAVPEKGQADMPPVEALLNYKPSGNKLTQTDVDNIRSAVRIMLGEKKYEVLSKVFSSGATKVVVDAGKINAKLNFNILQESESSPSGGSGGDPPPDPNKRIIIKRGLRGFGGFSRPLEMKGVHFFVKPPVDSDPQTHQVKANIYGEVEIQFKTVR